VRYAFKMLAYTLINLRHFCCTADGQNRPSNGNGTCIIYSHVCKVAKSVCTATGSSMVAFIIYPGASCWAGSSSRSDTVTQLSSPLTLCMNFRRKRAGLDNHPGSQDPTARYASAGPWWYNAVTPTCRPICLMVSNRETSGRVSLMARSNSSRDSFSSPEPGASRAETQRQRCHPARKPG